MEEEERRGRHYERPAEAPEELLCVRVALWQVVVACRPAGRMEMVTEEVEELGCVPRCLLMCAFCSGSCDAVAALELRPHPPVMARWRGRQMCVVCRVEEAAGLRIHLSAVCWKGCGLCWALVGGASLCCERRRRVEWVPSDWGLERCHDCPC